ncbi:MAG: DUF4230 domain-containing protein [Deltaproteobacteria bacterium]|nr:DUF4230 domain-containing protein [Deltaproteobacteria bacterium]
MGPYRNTFCISYFAQSGAFCLTICLTFGGHAFDVDAVVAFQSGERNACFLSDFLDVHASHYVEADRRVLARIEAARSDRDMTIFRELLREQIEAAARGGELLAMVRDRAENQVINFVTTEWKGSED